jgi:phage shock protein A
MHAPRAARQHERAHHRVGVERAGGMQVALGRFFGRARIPGTDPAPPATPREQLEAAVAHQQEQLATARAAMAEVATGRRRLELLVDRHREQVAELDEQARTALKAGHEDDARRHLSLQAQLLSQIDALLQHRNQVAGQLDQLRQLSAQLRDQVERLQAEKVAILASLSAAQAQERAMSALASMPGGGADPGALLDQAREQAETLAIHAAATAEVAAATARGRAEMGPQPRSRSSIDQRLTDLRGQLGQRDS